MAIRINNSFAVPVLEIEGKFLGSVQGPDLQEELSAQKDNGTTNVVIDLSNTEFIDSSGIGVLIDSAKSMREAGGDVRLAGMHQRVQSVFLMSRLLGPVFENFEDAEAASASFVQPAGAS